MYTLRILRSTCDSPSVQVWQLSHGAPLDRISADQMTPSRKLSFVKWHTHYGQREKDPTRQMFTSITIHRYMKGSFLNEMMPNIIVCLQVKTEYKPDRSPKVAVTFNDIVLIYIFLYKKQFGHRPHELQVHFVPPQKLGTLGVIKSCCFSRFCTWLPSLCGLCRVHGQHFWRECLPGGRWKGEMSTRIAPRICNNMYQPARVHPDLSDLLESRYIHPTVKDLPFFVILCPYLRGELFGKSLRLGWGRCGGQKCICWTSVLALQKKFLGGGHCGGHALRYAESQTSNHQGHKKHHGSWSSTSNPLSGLHELIQRYFWHTERGRS